MFNAIIQTSLKQRLFVLMGALLLMLYGLFTLRQLPVDVFPDLNKPTVTLMTEAEGIAPEEVEQLVTFPLETAMNGLEGVTRVRSVSGVGLSIVYVEFGWGTDIYRNRQQVSERLGAVTNQLPVGVVPQMSPISSIMGEILLVAMTAEEPLTPSPSPSRGEGSKITPMEVRDLAEWVVRPRLLGIPGVSQVIPMGGEVRQYRITPDVANMERLNISISQLQTALHGFASNTSGGFLEAQSQEYLIRNIGRTTKLEDMQQLVVAHRDNVPILLQQVAKVEFAAGVKRGEASFMGKPAVILSVQKQPSVDTVKLTREVESALAEINRNLPAGVKADNLLFKQANFIESAISNVEEALRDGAIMVVIVLFLFLLNVRTTLISLTAIPLSLLAAGLVFHAFGLSVNTMTLGGLAIALGELVDDAVVDVENVLRRLRQNALLPQPLPALQVIAAASREVRSGVVYATLIVVLVFVPLFFLAGIEGRLFTPLGIAYIVSILASLGVAVTVTPVLCYYLLKNPSPQPLSLKGRGAKKIALLFPSPPEGEGLGVRGTGDSPLVHLLKRLDTRLLHWSFRHVKLLLSAAVIVVLLAIASIPFFPRAFLPAFNEGTLTVSLLLQPGISLTESNRIGTLAENLLLQVPEVKQVGRRTGRAELDEHAEGVHSSEIDVDLEPSERGRDGVLADIRSRLAVIPAAINIGQPISHRLDHLLSGVRAQIALKVFGDDTDTLRSLATALQTRLAAIPGVVDLQLEKQVRIPQLQVRVDYNKVQQYGVTPASINQALETLANGASVAQVLDNNRRADVVIRLQDIDRTAHGLRNLLVETHSGYIPLQQIASIEDSSGPNQIVRENSRRRIVLSANAADGADMAGVVQAIRAELADFPLPEGYFTRLEGQFQAQEEATQLIAMLALVSLTLIFLVLYSRYQSSVLALIIMGNIPLALVGGVVALWLAGQTLSVASLVGFITLAGISTRNGILKISHYQHLVQHEGETFGIPMIVRGSLERLTPVLMTALVAAFALLPLILASGEPGKEILHPVALVIFGGLVSSTLLDTLLTPVLFYRWGEQPLNQLLSTQGDSHETV